MNYPAFAYRTRSIDSCEFENLNVIVESGLFAFSFPLGRSGWASFLFSTNKMYVAMQLFAFCSV